MLHSLQEPISSLLTTGLGQAGIAQCSVTRWVCSKWYPSYLPNTCIIPPPPKAQGSSRSRGRKDSKSLPQRMTKVKWCVPDKWTHGGCDYCMCKTCARYSQTKSQHGGSGGHKGHRSCGAVGSWWLLGERESVFFKDAVPTCPPVDRATLSGHSGFKTTETQELRETGWPSGEGTEDEMGGGVGFQNITNAFIKFSNKNLPPLVFSVTTEIHTHSN